jgi:hypothetical protein
MELYWKIGQKGIDRLTTVQQSQVNERIRTHRVLQLEVIDLNEPGPHLRIYLMDIELARFDKVSK